MGVESPPEYIVSKVLTRSGLLSTLSVLDIGWKIWVCYNKNKVKRRRHHELGRAYLHIHGFILSRHSRVGDLEQTQVNECCWLGRRASLHGDDIEEFRLMPSKGFFKTDIENKFYNRCTLHHLRGRPGTYNVEEDKSTAIPSVSWTSNELCVATPPPPKFKHIKGWDLLHTPS
jgi:hypothetical protein